MLKLLALELAGADAVTLLDGEDEHAPVADFPGARRLNDGLHCFVHDVLRHDDFDLHLRQQADGVLLAPIDGRVTFLLPVAADLRDRDARDTQRSKCVLDLVYFVRAHDRFDQFHTVLQPRLVTRSPTYLEWATGCGVPRSPWMTYSGYASIPCSCRSSPSISPSREIRSVPVAFTAYIRTAAEMRVVRVIAPLPIACEMSCAVPPP